LSAPFRFPKFFVTNPSPCPYLPGKVERKVFTELSGRHAAELNEALGRIGFRRSQSVAYRPSCIECSACVSVRVLAAEFEASATQRKILRRHADLEVSACKPWTTDEQYELLRRYLSARHPGGGMAEMDEGDFADMVEQTPVRTYVIEYREPSVDGRPGKLVGACLSDQQADGNIQQAANNTDLMRESEGEAVSQQDLARHRKSDRQGDQAGRTPEDHQGH